MANAKTAKRLRSIRRRGQDAKHGFYRLGRLLGFEPLESRAMLSAAPAGWTAQPDFLLASEINSPANSSSPNNEGLSANQMRGAYGLGTYSNAGVLSGAITFQGVQGTGAGETIAIVDAYNDPNILADAATFSTAFSLPQFNVVGGPTLKVLNQNGGSSLANVPNSTGALGNWAIEESLDVEWAHAIAPQANIILFEAVSDSNALYAAVQTAAATPGVVAVSMSWSGSEYSGETSDDAIFTTPSGHTGVTFLAATGDYGPYAPNKSTITPHYPATSPIVVAVCGTTLAVSGNSFSSVTVWGSGTSSDTAGGSGGGISQYETDRSFQSSVVGSSYSTTHRVYPDVSADGNPHSGVAVCDSYDYGSSAPWIQVGGTSLATPMWAAMISIVDQGRAVAGLSSLDGPSQTLPLLYDYSSTGYHDITSAGSLPSGDENLINTGPEPIYEAATGYDLTSGIGSPIASTLLPDLAGSNMLAFAQSPTNTTAGTAISPAITVDVENAFGQIVTSDNSNVTISLGTNPSNGNLLGTLTVAAVNGVATFSGISIDATGTGYTLVASDGGLTTSTSAAFNITANASQPTITTPASATPNGANTNASLSVAATDPASEALTYTWSVVSLPSGASAPTYSVNGSSASQNTTATFSSAGTYTFLVTITDTSGLSIGSTVNVTINQVLTSASIAPNQVIIATSSQQQFTAMLDDQFGNSMLTGQPSFTWSATTGMITSAGLYTAPSSAALATITVVVGGMTATATVEVGNAVWTLNGTGSWPTTSDWNNSIVASGVNVTADFSTLNITSNKTVSLNGAQTVGNLIFGDTTPSNNWTLNTGTGGPLTLALTSGTPTITVNNRTATINAVLNGTEGLNVAGAGNFVQGANETLSGGITVGGGIYELASSVGGQSTNPFGAPNQITIDSNATFDTTTSYDLGVDLNTVWDDGGTLELNGFQYVSSLQMTGGTVSGPGTLQTEGGAMTFNAASTTALRSPRVSLSTAIQRSMSAEELRQPTCQSAASSHPAARSR